MVTVAQQHQDNQHQSEEDQNGGHNTGDHRAITIRGVVEEETTIDYPSSSVGTSSLEDKGYNSTEAAICARSESDLRRLDQEDVSRTSSTQYSDVDDSLAGDELGSWSNDLDLPVSLQQNFDNGVSLPISEVPTFGDVCVKNSANVHFGNKTFYNGPVTIKQIVYANPNSAEDDTAEDIRYDADKLQKNGTAAFAPNEYRTSDKKTKSDNPENPQDDSKVIQSCAWLLSWRCVALMCAVGSCLVAAVVIGVVLLSRDSEVRNPIFPQIPVSGGNDLLTKLRFIERAEWGAQPPTEVLEKMKLPVPYVIISHTATDFCETQSDCTFRVRFAQTFHIESRGWSDIAYNFLIGGDGYAYVGRSWEYVGAHSYGYNTKSIGISFIGTFNKVIPPQNQLNAAQQLIEFGVKIGKIAPDYKLLGHRQISKTLSPGDALYSVITTWPHWSPTP